MDLGVADKRVVFVLMDELRLAWEKILNDYMQTHHTGIRYIDGWMACHNFFKLALDHLVIEAGLTGDDAALVFRGAADTFDMAMKARALQCYTQEDIH